MLSTQHHHPLMTCAYGSNLPSSMHLNSTSVLRESVQRQQIQAADPGDQQQRAQTLLVVLLGIPGAGKTTLAKHFYQTASRYQGNVHLLQTARAVESCP